MKDARSWLALRQSDIIKGAWMPPQAIPKIDNKLLFGSYATAWLVARRVKDEPLKVRTREHPETPAICIETEPVPEMVVV